MKALQSPTVLAAIIIGGFAVLAAWIVASALKRFGRGLTEMARATNTFSARLDDQNKIASTVDSHQRDLEELVPLARSIDEFLTEWGSAIRVIPRIDEYLRRVDGDKYVLGTTAEQEPVSQPETEEVPPAASTQQPPPVPAGYYVPVVQMGPNPQYPGLPFDPMDQASVEQYMQSLVPKGIPLDTQLPAEMSHGFGAGYTWRERARAEINMQYAELFQKYGLPPLGSDLTQGFRRPPQEPPTT